MTAGYRVILELRGTDAARLAEITGSIQGWTDEPSAVVSIAELNDDDGILADTRAGLIRIGMCGRCGQQVEQDRKTRRFITHDRTPLLRVVCPGSGKTTEEGAAGE